MAGDVCEYFDGASGWMAGWLLSKIDALAEGEKASIDQSMCSIQ